MTFYFEPVHIDDCSDCQLGRDELCHRCVPTCEWRGSERLRGSIYPRNKRCLYVIGEAPGHSEDIAGVPFFGKSGKILDGWLEACNLTDYFDVFLANAVRCKLPFNVKPLKKDLNACFEHTKAELKQLRRLYPGQDDLVILCLGTHSCQQIFGALLKRCLSRQAERIDFGDAGEIPCFATYHPANTMQGRDPVSAVAVKDHLRLMCRWMTTGEVWEGEQGEVWSHIRYAPPPPKTRPLLVSLDVETYGCIEGLPEQRMFQVERSLKRDKVKLKDLVQTVQIAWMSRQGNIKTGVFLWDDEEHRSVLLSWLRNITSQGIPLLFMNGQFDLQYLRRADKRLRRLLNYRTVVEDLSVYNYLFNPDRPEKSLKNIAPLVGVARYEKGEFQRHSSNHTRKLLIYGQKDAVATMLARKVILQQIKQSFPGSKKVSKFTRNWYSDLTWLGVHMSEVGIQMDVPALRNVQHQEQEKLEKSLSDASELGLTIRGGGSTPSIRALVEKATTEAGLWESRDLQMTDKGGLVSTSKANVELILDHLPDGSENYTALITLGKFRKASKLLNTYLRPLIGTTATGPTFERFPLKKGRVDWRSALIDGRAYPTWSIVPMGGFSERSDDMTVTGTKQGRITPRDPGLQTFPRRIKDCICSRHKDGFVLSVDLSQIELRVGAFLSGDKKMLKEYELGMDRHTLRALDIFETESELKSFIYGHPTNWGNKDIPAYDPSSKLGRALLTYQWDKSKWSKEADEERQVGKQGNFLILYRGGWRRLVQAVREEVGFKLNPSLAKRLISQAPQLYPEFWEWQEELIRLVTRQGYIDDPILGQGRMFTKSRTINKKDYGSTIVNFSIQSVAANILLAAQVGVDKDLRATKKRSVVCTNDYDSMTIDGPREELELVEGIVAWHLGHTAYLGRLMEHYGRLFKVVYESKTKFRTKE